MDSSPLRKISVSAFIFREGKLLILKRAATETFLPGVWEVPGGGIDAEETIEQGVVREVREEAGIVVAPQTLFGFFEYKDGEAQNTVNLNFICTMNDASEEVTTHSGEMEGSAWITLAECDDYIFTSESMKQACQTALRR